MLFKLLEPVETTVTPNTNGYFEADNTPLQFIKVVKPIPSQPVKPPGT